MGIYILEELCAPTEFATFYEIWTDTKYINYGINYSKHSNIVELSLPKYNQTDDRELLIIKYRVTRVFHSYKSSMKDDKYNNGYVSFEIEILEVVMTDPS